MRNKLNFYNDKEGPKRIALITVAVALVFTAAFLGFKLISGPKVYAIDFAHLTEQEVQEWAKKEKIGGEQLKVTYQYSETVPKGILISQTPAKDELIETDIQLIFSNGYDPKMKFELPKITAKTTKAQLEKWFKDNKYLDVNYEYVLDEEAAKDTVLKMNVSGSVSRDTPIVVTLSAGDDIENIVVTVPDLTSYTKENINAWASTNMINIRYNNIYSDSHPAGKVLSQSVAKGTEVKAGTNITVDISAGKAIVMSDFYGKTQAQIREWAKANGVEVVFEKVYSRDVAEGYIVSTNPKANANIREGSTVYAYVSMGENPKDKQVTVAANYIGKTEADFLKYIRSLGLTASKTSATYYSTTIASGSVYSYEDGTFPADKVISYSLSRGPYVYEASQFEGKIRSGVEAYVQAINNLNGHLSLKLTDIYDSRTAGTVFNCNKSQSGSSTNVSCSLSLGPKPVQYSLPNFVGGSSPCGGADSCTIADGHIQIKISYEISDKPVGQVLSQSIPAGNVDHGTVVTLVVAKEAPTAYMPSVEDLDAQAGADYEATVGNLQSVLSTFENVSYQRMYSKDYTKGHIVSVSVNGRPDYEPGYYPVNTPIVIIISDGLEN